MAGEFDIIRRVFQSSAMSRPRPPVTLGSGDDCMLVAPPPGHELALSTDTLVDGVHFPHGTHPWFIGWRALAVSVSDLAAMGAEPAFFLLALSVESGDDPWFEALAQGLCDLAQELDIQLSGGDLTRGPLSLTVTVGGMVPAGQALRRDGAQPGQSIWLTGPVGAAAGGLRLTERFPPTDRNMLTGPGMTAAESGLLTAFLTPRPRIRQGLALRGQASACLDVSDGVLADLAHITTEQGLGARIDSARIPLAAGLDMFPKADRMRMGLSGGDDYELLFCSDKPPAGVDAVRVGVVTATGKLFLDDQEVRPDGYVHFV